MFCTMVMPFRARELACVERKLPYTTMQRKVKPFEVSEQEMNIETRKKEKSRSHLYSLKYSPIMVHIYISIRPLGHIL